MMSNVSSNGPAFLLRIRRASSASMVMIISLMWRRRRRHIKEIIMTMLAELARLIRSKNAGPFELTFDIMFDDAATYERVKRSGAVSREAVAARYNLPASEVKFFYVCLLYTSDAADER